MSNRRIFITTAEAIRTADLGYRAKSKVVFNVALALKGTKGFDYNRFHEHALSDTPNGKWAFNRRTGEGPGQVG